MDEASCNCYFRKVIREQEERGRNGEGERRWGGRCSLEDERFAGKPNDVTCRINNNNKKYQKFILRSSYSTAHYNITLYYYPGFSRAAYGHS